MWSPLYFATWGCRCCKETSPSENVLWDIYAYHFTPKPTVSFELVLKGQGLQAEEVLNAKDKYQRSIALSLQVPPEKVFITAVTTRRLLDAASNKVRKGDEPKTERPAVVSSLRKAGRSLYYTSTKVILKVTVYTASMQAAVSLKQTFAMPQYMSRLSDRLAQEGVQATPSIDLKTVKTSSGEASESDGLDGDASPWETGLVRPTSYPTPFFIDIGPSTGAIQVHADDDGGTSESRGDGAGADGRVSGWVYFLAAVAGLAGCAVLSYTNGKWDAVKRATQERRSTPPGRPHAPPEQGAGSARFGGSAAGSAEEKDGGRVRQQTYESMVFHQQGPEYDEGEIEVEVDLGIQELSIVNGVDSLESSLDAGTPEQRRAKTEPFKEKSKKSEKNSKKTPHKGPRTAEKGGADSKEDGRLSMGAVNTVVASLESTRAREPPLEPQQLALALATVTSDRQDTIDDPVFGDNQIKFRDKDDFASAFPDDSNGFENTCDDDDAFNPERFGADSHPTMLTPPNNGGGDGFGADFADEPFPDPVFDDEPLSDGEGVLFGSVKAEEKGAGGTSKMAKGETKQEVMLRDGPKAGPPSPLTLIADSTRPMTAAIVPALRGNQEEEFSASTRRSAALFPGQPPPPQQAATAPAPPKAVPVPPAPAPASPAPATLADAMASSHDALSQVKAASGQMEAGRFAESLAGFTSATQVVANALKRLLEQPGSDDAEIQKGKSTLREQLRFCMRYSLATRLLVRIGEEEAQAAGGAAPVPTAKSAWMSRLLMKQSLTPKHQQVCTALVSLTLLLVIQ
jgi:hypothetical protein